jgi:hypothetical protein
MPQIAVNVQVLAGRYVLLAEYPWIVLSHDALVYYGCRLNLHVRGSNAVFRVRLGWIDRINAEHAVYEVTGRPIGCPMYIAFPRPPWALEQPRISPERLDGVAGNGNFRNFMNF